MTDRKTDHALFRPMTLGCFIFSICLFSLISFGQPASVFSAPMFQELQDAESEIANAREKVNSAEKKYQVTKKLSETGSASKKQVRITKLQRDLSIIELSTLVDPSRRQKNLMLRAKLVLNYRIEDLAVVRRLYQRGSASEVAYRRAVAARDVARAEVEAIASATDTQRKLKTIESARSKYQLAQEEFNIAEKLFKSGSMAQANYDLFASRLETATAEWESTKKSLGARATVVEQ